MNVVYFNFNRVMFGSTHLYVFHHPQDAAIQEKEGHKVEKVSFNTAQEEIAQNKGFDMGKAGKSPGGQIFCNRKCFLLLPNLLLLPVQKVLC